MTEAWIALDRPPPLPDGEVHLWRVAVPAADGLPTSWTEVLTDEERAQVARKRIPLDARRTLTSRACLRLLLGCYLGVPAPAIALAANATGKPQLATPRSSPTLEFNVSHSGDWVVLAFARGVPVGIDVECQRELEFSDLVRSFFSPAERETWSTIPPGDRMRAFFSAWTRKEAYLKALGLGLSKALDSFSVSFEPHPASALLGCAGDEAAPGDWRVVAIDVAPGYACALAAGSAVTTVRTFTFAETCPRETADGDVRRGRQ